MKGQGSIEFMMIVAAMLVVSATFTHSQMLEPAGILSRETEDLARARIASDKIATGINRVFKNGEAARTTEFVKFSGIENLEITEDNVQISIFYDEERIWTKSSIEYGFENSLPSIFNDSYVVIFEWDTSKPEGIRLLQENRKIYINIRPGEG